MLAFPPILFLFKLVFKLRCITLNMLHRHSGLLPNNIEVLEPKNLPLFFFEPIATAIATTTAAIIINPVIIFFSFLFNLTIFYLNIAPSRS